MYYISNTYLENYTMNRKEEKRDCRFKRMYNFAKAK
jgi:hypothetical protein